MKKNEKKNSSIIVTVVFVIIVILLLGVNLTTMFQSNEIMAKNNELGQELDDLVSENERLEYEISKFADYDEIKQELGDVTLENEELQKKLNEALDEETIRRIAKEKLGLVDPNEEQYIVS